MTKSISIILGCLLFGDFLIVPLFGAIAVDNSVAHFDGKPIAIHTDTKLEYYQFQKLGTSSSFMFFVKSGHDAFLKLSGLPDEKASNFLVILGNNSHSFLCKHGEEPSTCTDIYVDKETPGILSAQEYKGFWITIQGPKISVGKAGQSIPFMNYTQSEPLSVNYVSVRSFWADAPSFWLLYDVVPHVLYWAHDVWEKSQDHAFQGWQDITGEPLYIIRLRHKDPLTVYNYFPSLRFVSFGYGKLTNGMYPNPGYEQSYEVLCGGANATWVSAAGVVRPPNAFPSGSTKDGDTLYICRASYGNTLAVGQVASDNNCYILLDDGKELISKDNYEVLVY
uniref:Farnesoic acid O-methyl transferase domain-containing protein n=1 Tax=Cacopsylla melanoneura TaxID=428564 RepID=A0A8D8ZLW1_9HEMI